MASSGSFQNTFQTGYALRVEWEINSQSVANNTSSLTVTAYLVSLGSSYIINSNYSKDVTLSINGTTYSDEISDGKLTGNQKREIMTKTVTIAHNTDGTKSVALRCSIGLKATLSGTYFGTVYAPASGSQTVTLDAIARLTTPTTSGTFNVGSAVTINTPRAASSFTHTLQYSLNNSSWTNIATGVGTSQSWTLPSALATAKPNAKSGTVYIRCITYSGSTNIGNKVISRTYNITSDYAAPTVAIAASQSNTAGISQYIRGISTVTLKATATLKYSAKVAKYVFTYGGVTKTVTSTSASASVTFTLPASAAASYAYSVKLTDSRGFTDSVSGTITTVSYSAPTISGMTITRGNYNGSTFTEDSQGNSLKISANATITSLSNANAKNYKIEYRLSNDTSYTTLIDTTAAASYAATIVEYTSAIFSENASYVVRFTLLDSFESVSQIMDVSSKKVLMNFSANGRAMCIGGIASVDDALEIALETFSTGGIKPIALADGTDFNEIVKTGVYVGSVNTQEMVNAPIATGSFTLIVDSAGTQGQLMQRYYYCHKTIFRSYVRFYYNSAWGDWQPAEGYPVFNIGNYSGQIKMTNGFMMQWGRVSIASPTANETVTVAITFPQEFALAPVVMAHPHTSVPFVVGVSASVGSVSGTTIYLTRTNTVTTWVDWIAIGKGAV